MIRSSSDGNGLGLLQRGRGDAYEAAVIRSSPSWVCRRSADNLRAVLVKRPLRERGVLLAGRRATQFYTHCERALA
eukprot:9929023-Alexandrium_andersonii.AAC.1